MSRPLSRRAWCRIAAWGAALAAVRPLSAQTAAPLARAEAQGGWINLAGNENPFGPSPAVMRAILRAAPHSSRYPFREEERLREEIAAFEDVDPASIVLGHGCDDILALAAHACIQEKDTLVLSEPTYFQLPDYALKLGARLLPVPHVRGSMRHDLDALANAVEERTRLLYICNPDNPTGTELPAEDLSAFCREVAPRCPIVIDEVYLELTDDFAAKTQVPLVRAGLPVIITRSFSKVHGLAGHRVGYAVTTPTLATALNRWQRSSLNYIGVAAARAALTDPGFVDYSRRQVRAGRDQLATVLTELGLPFTPSQGNFIFHQVRQPMADFQASMKKRGLLVGWPHPAAPGYPDWCRTSIGTESEMRSLIAALRAEFARPAPAAS